MTKEFFYCPLEDYGTLPMDTYFKDNSFKSLLETKRGGKVTLLSAAYSMIDCQQ